jgi:hypothetical protein
MWNNDYEDDMVGVQHAKGASEKTIVMIIDMLQMKYESERR